MIVYCLLQHNNEELTLKIEYAIILKCQRLTEGMDVANKLTNNISFHNLNLYKFYLIGVNFNKNII